MVRRRVIDTSMKELPCRCGTLVKVAGDAVKVTCSMCVQEDLRKYNKTQNRAAKRSHHKKGAAHATR